MLNVEWKPKFVRRHSTLNIQHSPFNISPLTPATAPPVFEDSSHHIAIGLDYLPAIARRLHHSRDLGEPFDFLTWFEFAPRHAEAFDELVRRLRETEEWRYVEREIDIRLTR